MGSNPIGPTDLARVAGRVSAIGPVCAIGPLCTIGPAGALA
jgi:hypothetical protein